MRPASWAALAVVVVWAAVPALAQALDPAVSLEADDPHVLVPFDDGVVASWSVRNDGPLEATVSLDLDGAWETDFRDAYAGPFTLESGASRTLHLRVVAPDADAVPEGGLTLSATATDASGRTASDAAEVRLTYVPAPPVVVPPPDHTVRDVLLGVAAGALLLGLAYASLGRSVAVRPASQDLSVMSLNGAWVRVELRNRAPWEQVVQVRLRSGPGLVASTDADVVVVPGRSVRPLSLFVRHGADGTIAIEARTSGHRWARRARVRVESVAATTARVTAYPETV